MDRPVNRLKRALADGQPQIGLHLRIPSSYAAEAVAGAGFDWMLIDTEHTPTDDATVLAQLQALAAYPVSVGVHLPWNDMVVTKRMLDAGAQTIAIPHVSTAEEAERAVSFTRFAPKGKRGFANVTRASRFGRVDDYFTGSDAELCVIAMIETEAGLRNLPAICAVDGIDAVLIGPGDLRASLGYPPGAGGAEFDRMMENAIREARARGCAAGVVEPNEAAAKRWMDCGALLMIVGADLRLLTKGADELRARFASLS
ncbi:MAG: HpcH/HpaI aldolase/citrate lyase family protein [Burkholderiaceae bacterium]